MSLRIVPAIDSAELANARRRELDISRDRARLLGISAMEAARDGRYVAENRQTVDWKARVETAMSAKASLPPDAPIPARSNVRFRETEVVVANETTLNATRRLCESGRRPLTLNFANGVEPGGGVLSGSRAQEELLCRSSALLLTLEGDPMYDAHRLATHHESSDWAILSPDVPVFRRDDGTSLAEPWLASFISCAAPYAPRVGQPRSGDLLERRIQRVLAVAHAHAFDTLVLGAWGCGAFANDPCRTARDFRSALEHDFDGAFLQVVFAIADWSAERRFLGPFRDSFAT